MRCHKYRWRRISLSTMLIYGRLLVSDKTTGPLVAVFLLLLQIYSHKTCNSSRINGIDWCAKHTERLNLAGMQGINQALMSHPQDLHLSFTRDGSVWARFGSDSSSADWTFVDEPRLSTQISVLDPEVIRFMESINYTDYCSLTDLDFRLKAEHGWHPSHITVFDPADKQTKVLLFRPLSGKEDCRTTNTSVSLAADKQRFVCDGGKKNVCGLRNFPPRGQTTSRVFLKSVNLDPMGPDSCDENESEALSNSYTFRGSYYYAYVKLADCRPPQESRLLGHSVKIRPHRDDEWTNMVLLPDPLQGAISDGLVESWQIFVKILSIQHSVFLQIWRPTAAISKSAGGGDWYMLVGQTFVRPTELRVVEVEAVSPIRVRPGDVLGLYFPIYNPIGWSSVPCAYREQRYKFMTRPSGDFTVGSSHKFTTAISDIFACRQYSFAAIFANRSESPSVDDWLCPASAFSSRLPMLPRRGVAGSDQPSDAHSVHGLDLFPDHERPGETSGRLLNQPKRGTPPSSSDDHSEGTTVLDEMLPIHLLLITAAVLLALLAVVGGLSYYRAVNS